MELDLHYLPPVLNWGIKPVLFKIGSIPIYAYLFFNSLGFIVGLILFMYLRKERNKQDERSIYVLMGGLVGAFLGAMLTMYFVNGVWRISRNPILLLFSGRTILGGILGGVLGSKLVKSLLGIKTRFGNLFAPPIALAVAIGRIGCLLRGCCFGRTCSLPWGVDFGDGLPRHPTQVYEAVFMFGLFLFLWWYRKRARDGELFYLLGTLYLLFRFFNEFLRVSPKWGPLTVFQWISIVGFIWVQVMYREIIWR